MSKSKKLKATRRKIRRKTIKKWIHINAGAQRKKPIIDYLFKYPTAMSMFNRPFAKLTQIQMDELKNARKINSEQLQQCIDDCIEINKLARDAARSFQEEKTDINQDNTVCLEYCKSRKHEGYLSEEDKSDLSEEDKSDLSEEDKSDLREEDKSDLREEDISRDEYNKYYLSNQDRSDLKRVADEIRKHINGEEIRDLSEEEINNLIKKLENKIEHNKNLAQQFRIKGGKTYRRNRRSNRRSNRRDRRSNRRK